MRALDVHGNELSIAERRVRIGPARAVAGASPVESRHTRVRRLLEVSLAVRHGGRPLAAGGAALYFATRPTADVYVGGAHVEQVP